MTGIPGHSGFRAATLAATLAATAAMGLAATGVSFLDVEETLGRGAGRVSV
jgi:hypothetical protein